MATRFHSNFLLVPHLAQGGSDCLNQTDIMKKNYSYYYISLSYSTDGKRFATVYTDADKVDYNDIQLVLLATSKEDAKRIALDSSVEDPSQFVSISFNCIYSANRFVNRNQLVIGKEFNWINETSIKTNDKGAIYAAERASEVYSITL